MASPRMVLVVYADPEDRERTVVLLEAAGYQVAAASNFEEAKQFLATETPDVLITDLRLGSYNGLHLVLRSRTDHPDMAAKKLTVIFPQIEGTSFNNILLKAQAEKINIAQDVIDPVTGHWLHLSVTPYADGLIVIFYDIQNEKKAEEEISKQHNILKQAEELAQAGSWEYNVKTKVWPSSTRAELAAI